MDEKLMSFSLDVNDNLISVVFLENHNVFKIGYFRVLIDLRDFLCCLVFSLSRCYNSFPPKGTPKLMREEGVSYKHNRHLNKTQLIMQTIILISYLEEHEFAYGETVAYCQAHPILSQVAFNYTHLLDSNRNSVECSRWLILLDEY